MSVNNIETNCPWSLQQLNEKNLNTPIHQQGLANATATVTKPGDDLIAAGRVAASRVAATRITDGRVAAT